MKHNSLRIINKDALTSELTCLTVDQAFINIPIELFGKYQIQDIINDIEAMGVIVNVNVEALSFDNIGEKRIQTFEGYSVITYSMKFYKYTIFGYHGCYYRFAHMWHCGNFSSSTNQKRWWTGYLFSK